MKSALQTKLLQHLAKKKNQNGGFTLIELLVVIVIIGVLAGIALPSFLSQASKAKEAEAKNYTGAVNSAQQAYRVENTTFATDLANLNLGLDFTGSDYYTYALAGTSSATAANFTSTPKDAALKGVRGCVTADANGVTTSKLEVAATANTTPSSCP
jgi:type IV pilus assembly protein PilA